MLKFVCKNKNEVKQFFLTEFIELMCQNEITTVVGDYYDDDLEELLEVFVDTDDGFIFDKDDEIGEEPYGCVSDFFESVLNLIQKIKNKFPEISVEGYFSVNDIGVMECVLREGVKTENGEIVFVDQLQCACCGDWIDAKNAIKFIQEEWVTTLDGEDINMNAYSRNGIEAGFCLCSEECASNFLEN